MGIERSPIFGLSNQDLLQIDRTLLEVYGSRFQKTKRTHKDILDSLKEVANFYMMRQTHSQDTFCETPEEYIHSCDTMRLDSENRLMGELIRLSDHYVKGGVKE